jgi:hypothetical protein
MAQLENEKTKPGRATLLALLSRLDCWDCFCQGCMEMRASILTQLTGLIVHPLQMTEAEPTVEACLREFATEINFDEFVNGTTRPSRPPGQRSDQRRAPDPARVS